MSNHGRFTQGEKEVSVIALANSKTQTEAECSEPQQNARIQNLQMQWKSSEPKLN